MPNFTAEILMGVFGILMSLAQWLVPPFKRFQEKLGEWTPLFSAGVFFVITVGYMVANCQFTWVCIQATWGSFWAVFASALVTYYSSYSGIIKPIKAKQAENFAAELTESDRRIRELLER